MILCDQHKLYNASIYAHVFKCDSISERQYHIVSREACRFMIAEYRYPGTNGGASMALLFHKNILIGASRTTNRDVGRMENKNIIIGLVANSYYDFHIPEIVCNCWIYDKYISRFTIGQLYIM